MQTYDKLLAQEAARIRRDLQRKASGERVLTHVPTGFEKIDSEYGGVRLGIVTELMAHTGDGKSSFLRQCAEGAARAGVGVLWFVAEDPADATAERQFSGSTGLGTTKIGRLDIGDKELQMIDRVAKESASWAKMIWPIFEEQDVDSVLETIDKNPTVNGTPVREVVIDYAQVLGSSQNLEDDIARLGKGLHARSRKSGFATLIGSQVATPVITRGREAWYSKRDISQVCPGLGDTEWCRRLEKLTKAVWSLFRPGRWLREFGEEAEDNVAQLHVKKANFGPMGWVQLGWHGASCRFLNV